MSSESNGRTWIVVGAALAFLAVLAGAFGAHGLGDSEFLVRKHGTEMEAVAGMNIPTAFKRLTAFNTAARYQMFHAIALVLLGLFANRFASRKLVRATGWLFVGGTILFSGSLYGLVLTDAKWLGPITPLGGLLQLAGWITFAIAAIKATEKTSP